MKNSGWKRDDGYSGCKTKRVGRHALVVFEDDVPAFRGGCWGFQAFDEEDERAMKYGSVAFEMSGIWSEEAAMQIAEMWAATRD